MVSNNNTFVKITNQDIYNQILDFQKSNAVEHEQILIHQKQTNGKVKLNRWIATTAISLILIVITALLKWTI